MDTKMSIPYSVGDPKDPLATIMSAFGNTIVLERHGWFVAIESNDIMKNSKRNQTTKCEITQ